jgi:serine protease Do
MNETTEGIEKPNEPSRIGSRQPSTSSMLLSTMLSLVVVLVLLLALRLMLPSMLEFSRYSWHRGQLRAEYEMAGEQLQKVSLEGLSSLSQIVAKRVCPSVVHITLDGSDVVPFQKDSNSPADRRSQRRSLLGQGSGVVVDKEGYILTNYHVIHDDSSDVSNRHNINVTLADERVCMARLIGFDSSRDLAVLKIDATDLMPISWGNSDSVEVGEPVWAVGSPFGLSGSITFGILSGKHRLDLSGTSYDEQRLRQRFFDDPQRNPHLAARYTDLMQSDVAVNPGNSGGPLVNSRGELIGINTAIVGEAYRGVSFSIPSKMAKLAFDQIRESGKVAKGWLGVELVKVSVWQREQDSLLQSMKDENFQEAEDRKEEGQTEQPQRGAVVRRIVGPDAPAAKAGLRVGDLVSHIDGVAVKGVDDLIFAIGMARVGSTVQLSVTREGTVKAIDVVIGERPN